MDVRRGEHSGQDVAVTVQASRMFFGVWRQSRVCHQRVRGVLMAGVYSLSLGSDIAILSEIVIFYSRVDSFLGAESL